MLKIIKWNDIIVYKKYTYFSLLKNNIIIWLLWWWDKNINLSKDDKVYKNKKRIWFNL